MPDRPNPNQTDLPGFDLQEYLARLASRWMSIAFVGGVAAVIAFGVSLLLPAKYEATVLLTIQPPMGGASNPAAMSPAYLDSLRSYEQWVQGEALVGRLLQTERLDDFTVESFRRSALRVTLGRGTRTLQVSVRMSDAKRAHDLAVKLAEMAVATNSSVGRAESAQAREAADRDVDEARKPLESAQGALEAFNKQSRSDELWRQLDQQIERKTRYQTQLSDTEVSLAEQQARVTALTEQIAREPEKIRMEQRGQPSDVLNPLRQELRQQLETARTEAAGLRARRDALRSTLAALDPQLARAQSVVATIDSQRHALERDYQVAEQRFKALGTRATDTGIAAGLRHEELQISDPGVVPTRPVSPRPAWNAALGLLFGLLAGVLYASREHAV